MDLKSSIRTIVDYPKPGIRFRDITSLLCYPEAFRYSVDLLYQKFHSTELDGLIAVDARGFLFASALAYQLHLPLFLVRKEGKLPGETISSDYELEYATNRLEMHIDSFESGSRVAIIDDLIATGGTVMAAVELINELGGSVVACAVVVELTDLGGRDRISPIPLHSLVTFREDEI